MTNVVQDFANNVTTYEIIITYAIFVLGTALWNGKFLSTWSSDLITLIIVIEVIRIVKETNKELDEFYKKYEFKRIKEKK